MEILLEWQYNYCAGSPMSLLFRKEASQSFQHCYNEIISKHSNQYGKVLETPKILYRLLRGSFDKNKIYPDLYYSFSGSKEGLLYFAKKDKWLKSDLTLIIAHPLQALNYNELCGFSSRFGQEEEIVSKITEQSIIEIKYFDKIEQLEEFLMQAY